VVDSHDSLKIQKQNAFSNSIGKAAHGQSLLDVTVGCKANVPPISVGLPATENFIN